MSTGWRQALGRQNVTRGVLQLWTSRHFFPLNPAALDFQGGTGGAALSVCTSGMGFTLSRGMLNAG
ncbi:MAG TPA: hypothetical protein VK513_12820 [Terriglobales bacterium]|nr:hypothetical protein [Terriglobales bacterium]